jgi:magnesium-transporting ATPase (P-type)
MITGDKIETAINIGRSCGLIEPGSEELIISSETLLSIKKSLNKAFSLIREDETQTKLPLTIVFSGATFSKI